MAERIEKFEDLTVWQEGMQLAVDVYGILKECKDLGLKDQLQRSSVSIPSNIAEGFERNSNKEFVQFLYIAKSSCGELRTQLYLAMQLGLVAKEPGELLLEKTKKILAMLYNLIKIRKEKF
jgi:four helix bundle protein